MKPSADHLALHGARSNIPRVVGVVLILLFMFVVGPIGLFLVAGIWSAFFGWLLVDDTERREKEPQAS